MRHDRDLNPRAPINWEDAIKESACAFYLSPRQIEKLLDGSQEADFLKVEPGLDGRVVVSRNGERLPARDALREYASEHPELVKNSTELLLDGALVRSKSQFPSNVEKSVYISKYGADAYARLPHSRPRTKWT